jgi:hypothetical protein
MYQIFMVFGNSTLELLGLLNVANVDSRVVHQRIMCNQPIDKKHALSLNSSMKCKQRKKKMEQISAITLIKTTLDANPTCLLKGRT